MQQSALHGGVRVSFECAYPEDCAPCLAPRSSLVPPQHGDRRTADSCAAPYQGGTCALLFVLSARGLKPCRLAQVLRPPLNSTTISESQHDPNDAPSTVLLCAVRGALHRIAGRRGACAKRSIHADLNPSQLCSCAPDAPAHRVPARKRSRTRHALRQRPHTGRRSIHERESALQHEETNDRVDANSQCATRE